MRHCTTCGQETHPDGQGHYACSDGHVEYVNPAPAVGVAIMRGETILLAKRGGPPKQGQWDLVGGFVEKGESAMDAVRRETREETGMVLDAAEVVDVLPGTYGDQPTLNLLYIGRASGEPEASDDVAQLEWFPLDGLPEDLAWPHEAAMLQRLSEMAAAIQAGHDPNGMPNASQA